MKSSNSGTSTSSQTSEMFEKLRELDPRLRFVAGLIFCAVVAYYIPLVLIALTGIWVNNLTMMMQLVICTALLIVLNLVGNRLDKVFLTNIVLAVIVDCYEAFDLTRTSNWSAWHNCWMLFFFPTIACLLNAWLFLRFKAAAGLN